MLVLHSSSVCDVCLDPYASDSSSKAPHAIPCGHIFCGECLATVDPANCPLCRKPFLIERMKKLHVDKPESMDEVREAEFLKRLILAWDASEEELLALLHQIEEWLENKDEDETMTLRTALKVLSKYKKLRTRRADDHRVIKRLRDQMSTEDHQRATENQEYKAVEASLLAQVEGLQSQLSATQDEVLRLRTEASVRPGVAELTDLRHKVDRYENELEDLRPTLARARKYEHELKKLRQELDYYAYPSSNLRDNPLPQPPAPVSYEHLPTLAQAINTRLTNSPYAGNDTQHTINGYTSDAALHSEFALSKRNKGKEREPGPSYNLYSSSPPSSSPSEQVLRGASPSRRVVPTTKSKPLLPSAPYTMDPKLVSGARPDLPVPPTPQAGVNRPVDPARDFMDPYTLTAAYVSEYATGYGQGFQLAEITQGRPAGQLGVSMGPSNAGNQGTNGPGRYVNGEGERRERREIQARSFETMNALSHVLSEMGVTPTVRTSEISRDGNSQAFNSDTESVTTGDAPSLVSSISSRGVDVNIYTRKAPRESASRTTLSSTEATGYMTDTATLSSFSTGLTVDSTLTRNRSLRQQAIPRRNNDAPQLGLGLGFPSNVAGNPGSADSASRPRNLRHASVPFSSATFSATATTTTVATATTTSTTTAAAPQPSADNGSVRTAITQTSASSWGTINTHTPSLLDWQSTGGSSLNLPLRTFAAGAGMPLSDQHGQTDVNSFGIVQRSENRGSHVPEGMAVNGRSGRATNGGESVGAFPVRESDEERTPVSRSTRTLASVSSAGATVGSGSHVLDMLSVQISQEQQSSASQSDRERERDRTRDRDRTRSRDRRSQTHPASLVPANTGDGTRHAQMMTVTEHTTGNREGYQHLGGAPYSSSQQMSQLWFEGPPTSEPQPHVSHHTSQSQNQPISQPQSRRTHRRLSVSTAPVAAPITAQNTGSQTQAVVPNTAPLHAAAPWSEAGYYTDGPSSTRPHNTYNNHQNAQHNTGAGQNGSMLTSPTLFSSSSSSNALGLDGMNEPRPLQITAPTPIVSSRSFLRSFSYDNFS